MQKEAERSLTVKLPQSIAYRLRLEAARQDTSRHRLIRSILEEWVGQKASQNGSEEEGGR